MDGPWQIRQLQARGNRAEGARRREADAGDRSGFAIDRARIERHVHADLSRLGSRGPGGVLRPGGRHLAPCLLRQHKEWSGNSTARFLAMNLDMDRHIHEIAAVCDYVQGLQRSSKRLRLSFDEWNVWDRAVMRSRRMGGAPPRRGCSRKSTTSRMRSSSAGSSTRCSAIRIACDWRASRSWSTSSRRS